MDSKIDNKADSSSLESLASVNAESQLLPIMNVRLQVLILVLISILLYGNTIFNDYALDDGLVISDNKFTLSGLRGIPDILTRDTFYGALGPTVEVAAGRYRPLSVVTFAIEHQFLGSNPQFSRGVNVILFALTVILLFFFMRRFIFPSRPELAFLSTLLFAIHPIHTEVVANIKSRDEILSFLFLILTLFFLFRYVGRERGVIALAMSIVLYCLALFSKENGIVFIAIIPLALYFFSQLRLKKILLLLVPFLIVALGYIVVRFSVTGSPRGEITEVLNAPYLYATTPEKYATIVLVLGKYLQLLFFPYPLSYDYSYNQIPYVNFANPLVWVSLLIHLSLLAFALLKIKSKDIFSFCILYYFAAISIVSNIFVDIGAPMGERLLYQPSLAFCIAMGSLFVLFYGKVTDSSRLAAKYVVGGAVVLVLLLGSYETVKRNADWRNNEVLFLRDLATVPNSASANKRASNALISLSEKAGTTEEKEAFLNRAIQVLNRAIEIHPKYGDAYQALGVVYSRLNDVEKAEEAWEKAKEVSPSHTLAKDYQNYLKIAYMNKGVEYGKGGKYSDALWCLRKSIEYDSLNADTWYYLGGAYVSLGDLNKAIEAWEKAIAIDPNHHAALERLHELKVR